MSGRSPLCAILVTGLVGVEQIFYYIDNRIRNILRLYVDYLLSFF